MSLTKNHTLRMEAMELLINNCEYMKSKKQPLRLTFRNESIGRRIPLVSHFRYDVWQLLIRVISVIFTSDDDLRHEMITLQLLHLMDKVTF